MPSLVDAPLAMPSSDARLAAAQAALLDALTGCSPTPEGFSSRHIDAMGQILVTKRRKAMARACPGLITELRERFAPLVGEYASAGRAPDPGNAAMDVSAFLRWLAGRGLLTPALRRSAFQIDVARGFPVRMRWVREDRWLLIGYRSPRREGRVLCVVLGRRTAPT